MIGDGVEHLEQDWASDWGPRNLILEGCDASGDPAPRPASCQLNLDPWSWTGPFKGGFTLSALCYQ